MRFQGFLGYVNKSDFIRFLYQRFDAAFQKDTYRPETAFAKAYGVKGIYFADLDDDIPHSPLIMIQSRDLAELVAAKQLADYWADDEGYNEEAIARKADEISKCYLISNGMSEDTYKFFDNLDR